MNILLTGASGFIGKNIYESDLSKKYNICAPDKNILDLTDTDNVDKFFEKKNFDVVLHCATKPSHRNAKDLNNILHANLKMFYNIERHKKRCGKVINFGSGAVYSNNRNITNIAETDIFQNIGDSDHSFAKYILAKYIYSADNFIDLNLFGVFGKYEDWEIRFISNAICKSILGIPITLKQNRRFSYLFIDDIYDILNFFITTNVKYKSYNITPDNYITLYDAALVVQKLSNNNVPIVIAEDGYGYDYYGSNARLREEYKNVHFKSIETSIKILFEYYTNNIHTINYEKLLRDK